MPHTSEAPIPGPSTIHHSRVLHLLSKGPPPLVSNWVLSFKASPPVLSPCTACCPYVLHLLSKVPSPLINHTSLKFTSSLHCSLSAS